MTIWAVIAIVTILALVVVVCAAPSWHASWRTARRIARRQSDFDLAVARAASSLGLEVHYGDWLHRVQTRDGRVRLALMTIGFMVSTRRGAQRAFATSFSVERRGADDDGRIATSSGDAEFDLGFVLRVQRGEEAALGVLDARLRQALWLVPGAKLKIDREHIGLTMDDEAIAEAEVRDALALVLELVLREG